MKFVEQPLELGDLVAAAFDQAAKVSSDPRETSHLATRVVMLLLEHLNDIEFTEAPLAS